MLFRNILELWDSKPGTKRGSFGELSSSWSNHFQLPFGPIDELRPRWTSYMVKGFDKKITYCQPENSSGKQKRCVPQVTHTSAVETPRRRLKHTRFSRPFNSWQVTAVRQTSWIKSAEFLSCISHSPRQCPRFLENPRNLNCLQTFYKQASKCTTKWLKNTEVGSIFLLCVVMRCRQLKTSVVQPKIFWENLWQEIRNFRWMTTACTNFRK